MDNAAKIEYWTKYSFTKMRKEGKIMTTIIPIVLAMDEFQNSGVTEEQLRQSIKEKFAEERKEIVNKAKEKLDKLRENQ